MQKAIVLLSGGLDSTTLLKIIETKKEYHEIYGISFLYGQKHSIELNAAKYYAKECKKMKKHIIIDLTSSLGSFGGSALTDKSLKVPKNNAEYSYKNSGTIPITYVPGRNTIFIAYAMSYAEIIGANSIFIGANELDYSGYPDCRPAYIQKYNELMQLAVKEDVNIKLYTPLINMTKQEIIRKGLELNIDYSHTLSCYEPESNGKSCGTCDACKLRLDGFKANNVQDPIPYASNNISNVDISNNSSQNSNNIHKKRKNELQAALRANLLRRKQRSKKI